LTGLEKGVANRVPYALNTLAQAHYLSGDHVTALSTAQESIDWNEQRGNVDQYIWALRIFAEVCISQGEIDTALKKLSQAYALAFSTRMRPSGLGHCLIGKSIQGQRESFNGRKVFPQIAQALEETGESSSGKKD
jgi:tetratricopeptide (TPR) repeat protein